MIILASCLSAPMVGASERKEFGAALSEYRIVLKPRSPEERPGLVQMRADPFRRVGVGPHGHDLSAQLPVAAEHLKCGRGPIAEPSFAVILLGTMYKKILCPERFFI